MPGIVVVVVVVVVLGLVGVSVGGRVFLLRIRICRLAQQQKKQACCRVSTHNVREVNMQGRTTSRCKG